MLKQQDFDTDTVINIVVPDLNAAGIAALAGGLLKAATVKADADVADALIRELQLAPLGEGLAVTAVKVPSLISSSSVLAKLSAPSDLLGPDQRPVDLVCLLFYPESESVHYLRRLSRLSRLLKNADLCRKIRETQDADTIRTLFQNPNGWMLAA